MGDQSGLQAVGEKGVKCEHQEGLTWETDLYTGQVVAGKRLREFECEWGPQLVFKADQIVEKTRRKGYYVKIRE
jgi:hypothetical protein